MEFPNNQSAQSSEMGELEFVELSSDRSHSHSSYMNDFKEIFNNARATGRKAMHGGDDRTFFEEENDELVNAQLRKKHHQWGGDDEDDEDVDKDEYDLNFPDEYDLRKRGHRGGSEDFGSGVEINNMGDLEFEPTSYNNNQQGYEFRKQMLLQRIGTKMVGGKKELPPAMMKMIELSGTIRNSGPFPGVNLVGVAKLIWDDAISKLGGNSSNIDKIMVIATKSAEKPQIFVEKFTKIRDVGDLVLKSGTFKAVKPMDVGKLVWEEATEQAKSGASLSEIERIAKELAMKNPKSYVDTFKNNKKMKAANK
uniref:Uncharacterized protein n=1 Tax=viral metagenome TaxID=1070528 RepID=A0A6C0C9P2_9ZZZZ